MPISFKAVRGNALTEFAVLALVMVPAMSLVPMLGKVSDTNQSTIEAARYVAWERTVSNTSQKSDEKIATEVSNRFFKSNDIVIESAQGLFDDERFDNAFWSAGLDEDGKAVSLVSTKKQSLFVNSSNRAIPGNTGADILSDGVSTIAHAMSGLNSGANWDLEANGFYVAEVGVNISANNILSGAYDCEGKESEDTFGCMSRSNAIFVDGWTSDSPSQTKSRVQALVPGVALRPVGDFVSNFGALPVFKELKKIKGVFGDVQADILPLDRYSEVQ